MGKSPTPSRPCLLFHSPTSSATTYNPHGNRLIGKPYYILFACVSTTITHMAHQLRSRTAFPGYLLVVR